MATNPFFNNFNYAPEQNLLQSLSTEMIQMFGENCYYLPRKHTRIDEILTEDALSYFDTAILIEMYIQDYDGFKGNGDIMSKFGLVQGDRVSLCVSRPRFMADIGTPYNRERPYEGDLIYFPLSNTIFELNHCEHETAFYQRGTLQFWELQCEKFNYGNERFTTGITAIDAIMQVNVSDENFAITSEDGSDIAIDSLNDLLGQYFTVDEADSPNLTQNETFSEYSKDILDFSAIDPFLAQ